MNALIKLPVGDEELAALQAENNRLKATLALYRENRTLEESVCDERAREKLKRVLKAVADEYSIPWHFLFHRKTRRQAATEPKQVAMALTWEYSEISTYEIMGIFGNKERSLISYSSSRVRNRCETEPRFKARIDRIRKTIEENTPHKD